MKHILTLFALVLVFSCSLDHNNPLDPYNGVEVPPDVAGIDIQNIENDYILVSWERTSVADGYFIYRSQAYDLLYKKIKVFPQVPDSLISYDDTEVELPENFYYYKLSAYKIVEGDTLEGYRSEPNTWGGGN